MTRKQITMDRVFELAKRINDDWTNFNHELLEAILQDDRNAIRALHNKLDVLRNDYANLITLGQDDAWRYLAESNGVTLPDESDKADK